MAAPPREFMLVVQISNALLKFLYLVVPCVLLFLWFDSKVLRYLSRTKGRTAARIWSMGISLLLLALLGFSVWGLLALCRHICYWGEFVY